MFGAICANRPVQTNLQILSPTQFIFTIPPDPPFTHVVVFLLPDQILPPDIAAAVYIRFPARPRQRRRRRGHATTDGNLMRNASATAATAGTTPLQPQEFRFLGAIANDKPSAIFRVRGASADVNGVDGVVVDDDDDHDDDAMVDESPPLVDDMPFDPSDPNQNITLGISLEPITSVANQVALLKQQQQQRILQSSSSSTTLVKTSPSSYNSSSSSSSTRTTTITTKLLAQRIIQNAFNFLASFSSSSSSSAASLVPSHHQHSNEEMIPLKAFREWWIKFERRLDLDPSFLERVDDGGC